MICTVLCGNGATYIMSLILMLLHSVVILRIYNQPHDNGSSYSVNSVVMLLIIVSIL